MARCSICGKKSIIGNSRSHSNVASKRKFKPNLQRKRINGKKVLTCTRCLKSLYKNHSF